MSCLVGWIAVISGLVCRIAIARGRVRRRIALIVITSVIAAVRTAAVIAVAAVIAAAIAAKATA